MPLRRKLWGIRQKIPKGFFLGRLGDGDGDIELLTAAEMTGSDGLNVPTIPVDLTSEVTGLLPVSSGGTGGGNAADARTNLNVDVAGTDNSTDVTLDGAPNYITIVGQVITRALINLTSHVTGLLPVGSGGTGAATAGDARTNLDVDQAGTDNSTDVTLAGSPNYITIAGQVITRALINLTSHVTGLLPVSSGGTGGANAGDARTNLDVDQAGTDNSTDVTLGGSPNYITLAGQVLTRALINLTSHVTGLLPVASGGTAAGSAADARTNLDVDQAGTDNSTDVTLGGSPNYITLAGQVLTRALINLTSHVTGLLPVASGGTAAGTAADARTNLDVDQAGTDNSTDVTLAGTPNYIAIAGQQLTLEQIDLTADVQGDLPIADGGTGSGTASGARSNLGVDAAGTDNSTDVSLAGSPNYITIVGQVITRALINLTSHITGTLPVANGGTAGTTQATARSGIGLATISQAEAEAGSATTTRAFTAVRAKQAVQAHAKGSLLKIYTSNDTWTKPSDANFTRIKVWVVGGGGGGGGAGINNRVAAGGGGGAVGYSEIAAASLGATESVTVGAGGAGGSPGTNVGSAGAQSKLGSIITAGPGLGGAGDTAGPSFIGGGAGGTSSGADINAAGNKGGVDGVGNSGNTVGHGGAAGADHGPSPQEIMIPSPAGGIIGQWGGSGAPRPSQFGGDVDGLLGSRYGGGGSGGKRDTGNKGGGAGRVGVVAIIEEFE